jgi:hypothetical protein
MPQYTKRSELKKFAADMLQEQRVNLRKSAESRSPLNATFLSHSSKDDDLVDGTIRILTNHGAFVYIDKVDPTMPPYTNSETAAKLKTRVRQAKKFVLLASENSKDSKWVPWELGIADGYKDIKNIALFPAIEDNGTSTWTSWEYLGLYQRIVWGSIKGYDKTGWMVWDESDNTATWLSQWLSN